MKNEKINVYGMTCEHCVNTVTKAISALSGVNSVNVNLKGEYAAVSYDEQVVKTDDIKKAVKEAGYETEKAKHDTMQEKQYKFIISKMDCASCATTIVDTIKRIDGVKDAKLNFVTETLYVDSDFNKPTPDEIIKMVKFAGFGAELIDETTKSVIKSPVAEPIGDDKSANGHQENTESEKIRFEIEGMTCTNCARTIEKGIGKIKGIDKVTVNFAGESGFVSYDASVTSKDAIFKAVTESGYKPIDEAEKLKRAKKSLDLAADGSFMNKWFHNIASWKKDLYWLIFIFVIMVPVVILSYEDVFGMPYWDRVITLFVLSSTVQFTAGLKFYKGAYYSLRNFSANMDVLVSLGISAAYFYSVAGVFLFFNGEFYFDTSVLLILFITAGKTLEKISKQRAASSLKALFKLQTNKSNLVADDGNVMEVDTDSVKVGDILLVKKGDKIPVDGVIVDGQTQIDEAMLTGEPIPAEKKVGDEVSGSTINRGQVIRMKALRVGKDTMLSQIVRLVEDAQADKAPIQRIADQVTNYFVPVVVAISLISFVSWRFIFHANFLFALSAAIAVLVIACPCAMGLATPMALMIGSSIGLEKGILIKKASGLEEIARITAIVFDKTGTITHGKPEVTDIIPLGNLSSNEILKIAAYGEGLSSHPIAAAIVNKYKESHKKNSGHDKTEPKDYNEISGLGISMNYDGKKVLIGKRGLFESENIDLTKFNKPEDQYANEGKTVIGVSVNSEIIGIITLADKIKKEAKATIKKLKSMKIAPYLLTGDNANSAMNVAAQVGILKQNVIANVLPQGKLNEIKKLKNLGLKVAMVGDGINDAPALALADVGIAIGSGTDVARETGDIILVKSNILDAYKSVALGKRTLSKVKQNLFWAFIFNGLGIPFAAGVFYHFTGWLLPPAAAGAAMALSDIFVIVNSVMLRGYSKKMDTL